MGVFEKAKALCVQIKSRSELHHDLKKYQAMRVDGIFPGYPPTQYAKLQEKCAALQVLALTQARSSAKLNKPEDYYDMPDILEGLEYCKSLVFDNWKAIPEPGTDNVGYFKSCDEADCQLAAALIGAVSSSYNMPIGVLVKMPTGVLGEPDKGIMLITREAGLSLIHMRGAEAGKTKYN